MLQPFNMEMLQPFKNRTEQTAGTTYPNCIRHFLYFTSAESAASVRKKNLQELSMRLKIIFIFNTNHVKEHFSHLDNWCTGAREYVNSIGQSSGENENYTKKSFKRGEKNKKKRIQNSAFSTEHRVGLFNKNTHRSRRQYRAHNVKVAELNNVLI